MQIADKAVLVTGANRGLGRALVEFTLEEVEGGTALTIVESGFDRIPLARRAEAFRMNTEGWSGQIKNLAAYVS